MRVYFISKKLILRVLLLVFIISTVVLLSVPYYNVAFNVFSSTKEIPIYSVDTPKNIVSMTFDCAWGGEDIPKLLDILNSYNVKATFFMVGDWMAKYPEDVKLINKNGHDVANHSHTHLDMTGLNEDKIKLEILNANKKIEELTGNKNILFRAPFGAYNNLMVKTAKSMGIYMIQWDVDSLDWKDMGVEAIVSRVTNKVKNGSIILFHNDTKFTLDALPGVIEGLRNKGYEFVKLTDLFIKDNYYIDFEGRQHSLIKESGSID